MKQPAKKREQDQHNGQRVEEHQHRKRIGNDGVQTQIGNQEGQYTEDHCPNPIGRSAGEHACKGFAAAGDQSHCGFQAGHRHGARQNGGSRHPKIMVGNLSQCNAAIAAGLKNTATLGTDHCDQQINHRHQNGTEHPGENGVLGHLPRFFHPQTMNGIHHNDSKGQAGQRIHGIVSFQKTCGKRIDRISPHGLNFRDLSQRKEQRRHDQHCQEAEKQRVQNLSDPSQDLPRPQREKQRCAKKDQ